MLDETQLSGFFDEIEKIAASRWRVEARKQGLPPTGASRQSIFSQMQKKMNKPGAPGISSYGPGTRVGPLQLAGPGFAKLPGSKPPKVVKKVWTKPMGRMGKMMGHGLAAALFLPGMLSSAKEKTYGGVVRSRPLYT